MIAEEEEGAGAARRSCCLDDDDDNNPWRWALTSLPGRRRDLATSCGLLRDAVRAWRGVAVVVARDGRDDVDGREEGEAISGALTGVERAAAAARASARHYLESYSGGWTAAAVLRRFRGQGR